MEKCIILLGLLGLSSGLCLVGASKHQPWVLEKFRASFSDEAQQLAPLVVKVNADIKAKENQYRNSGEDMKVLEKLVAAKASSIKSPLRNCFSCGSESKNEKNDKRQVMEMLISLKGLVNVCDLNSLRVFAKLKMALDYVGSDSEVLRILLMVREYMNHHTKACEIVYRKKYDDLIQTGLGEEQKQLTERLANSMGDITMFDFRKIMHQTRCASETCRQEMLITMPDFEIHQDATKALEKIVLGIVKQLKDNQLWDSTKDAGDEELKETFGQYLFEPCKLLHDQQLSAILKPALISAGYDEISFYRYYSKCPDFFKVVFNYGLCEKILDERDQLYAELFGILRGIAAKELEKPDN